MNPKYRVVSIIVRGTMLACACVWAVAAAAADAAPAMAQEAGMKYNNKKSRKKLDKI
jgi:Spy/CpxP family protein refolding chaperone